jgi:TFIIH basal transcription factor complex TTD-A subunit
MKLDSEDHAYLVEDLDDQTVLVKETMLNLLKQKLKEVIYRNLVLQIGLRN